jgi:cytochrome c oxidase subunit 4
MADSHTETTHHAEGQPHASWKTYVFIGLILAIITAVEVAIFYIEVLAPVLVPILLVLSLGKFVTVVLFYMHLKFDHAIFGRVFWAPLFLAVLVVVGMIILFHVLPRFGKFA